MRLVVDKFSALELCDQGDYLGAAETLGLTVGQWPENRSQGGNSEQAEALLVAGIITSTIGGIQQSGSQAVAREMLEESFRLSGSWLARSWLAWTYYWEGELETAIEAVEECLTHDLGDIARFRSHYLLATIYWQQGHLEKAWEQIERMVPFYENCPAVMKGKFHGQRGLVLRSRKEFDRAVVEYDCAIHFFKGRDERSEGIAANNLASVYLETGQLEQAHQYADTARESFHRLGDKTYEAKSLDQLALIYLASKNTDKALEANAHSLILVDQGEIVNECLATSAKIKHEITSSKKLDNAKMSATSPTPIQATDRGKPMEPLDMVSLLLQNQPDNAVVMLDFIIWARANRNDPQHEAELDEIEESTYAKTPDCLSHLEEYRRSRLPTSDS